ncbi:MAG: dephospho-CoA kinase [Hyphomicrobium zavarzinii]|jgi:dephospho-CoA kinase|uniref:dephospho-CoA kinase n=1 Tax=Hyphomicrobium TaxID=81 RepID=UPI0003687529|nr:MULTISPECIES: dephospho-CoA kinase [Hyphomicrobium]MBL8844988.1 dephospho-CoA kinase [Hyphomicrobium zavarzinii]WBT38614.1 dephospho-CoA kinase [Hyphomicrobium sp. DMF-1]HML44049.1 dephospho-CoA kinase [Hyphomicrobium zavarzinii]
MQILGLTGSIGMGKSTIAAMFRERGIAVFDADAEVHRLYAGEAVSRIEAAFPGTTADGRVDRARLAAVLANNAERFRILEKIVHPLVRKGEQDFLRAAAARGDKVAVLEIPLLLETELDAQVDAVVVVSAPGHLQRARVLERPGMTDERLDALLERQMPDSMKRHRADFVVDTGGTLADSEAQVDAILSALRSMPADAYARHWR